MSATAFASHAGGGSRQTESEAPAKQATPARGAANVRNPRQGTARIGGGARQRGGTTKVGVRKERLGTQRVGMRRPGRIGGGTTRIGGRMGGTTVIGGGRRKESGPRGLFGGRSGRRDTQLVSFQALPCLQDLPSTQSAGILYMCGRYCHAARSTCT
jgi:hypothetical protein